MRIGHLSKMIALTGLLLSALAGYSQGQAQTTVGIGVGLDAVPVDEGFEAYEITNPIPIGRFVYYTTEIPAVILSLENSRYRLRFGANSVSLIYKERMERVLTETQIERTVYEIVNLNLYAALQSPGKTLWWCDGYLVGGHQSAVGSFRRNRTADVVMGRQYCVDPVGWSPAQSEYLSTAIVLLDPF
jgi:hypothetical protein